MPDSPFPTRTRPVVAGLDGAVASAHPLASAAGIDVLKSGGHAVDAVVTMAVALGVVEPYMSGVGGVGFLLVHDTKGTTRVLNFCGNTPARGTPDQFTNDTKERGIRAPLIPGNPAGWFEALRAYGTMPASRIFAPAIEYAERGFPLHPFNVELIRNSLPRLNPAGLATFGNLPLRIGAILKQPELGRTLRRLAEGGADYFYRGELAERIDRFMREEGGLITRDDLAGYRPDWESPIDVSYRGLTVKTCPPNNEGFQILQTLKLLEAFDLSSLGHNSADYIHLVSEAVKLAVADRIRWAGDPKFSPVPLDRLLSDRYIAERRKLIDRERASRSEGERWRSAAGPEIVRPGSIDGLTTHLAAVDAQGNVASITQSLGNGFGSGMFVPQTGVALNSFAHWCEIDPACPTPNVIAPGKRWAACMAPVHVFRDQGKFWFSIATPGSYGILHTTLQMLLNVVEFGADCQAAIEAPRFRLWEETRMQIETRVRPDVLAELDRRGHRLELLGDFNYVVGGGQSVMIDPQTGARLAGADPRRDGYALAY
ncbi:MAG TPA: gamma-glutamyltransferase [Planctomycetaceae bacterium]|nr:gamma-glutamyltransferase [Planctomycetaceae bacterium]